MRRSLEPLIVGRVIGDVVDMFQPSIDFKVEYPVRQVNNGCEIKPPALLERPRVQVGGTTSSPYNLYTMVMIDPDAPSPSEPSMREWIHWIVSDIPDGGNATSGQEILAYDPPQPTIGIHRYAFILYKQVAPMAMIPPVNRNNFKTRDFAVYYSLGSPVAAVYFNSQKQTGGRGRR
nr:flowering locus T/terminal flower 1_2 [Equisetum bogotense]